jgi:ABC-type lipopolysaccharide export system ATPase subunit
MVRCNYCNFPDEPFSYIMPVHVEKLKMIMVREKKTKGIILTDHLYQDLLDVKDSLYLIYDGESFPVNPR